MEQLCQTLFWMSTASLGYSYLGYPLLVSLAARRFGSSPPTRSEQDQTPTAALPRVTVLIAAYNAARQLEQRINNLLASDYPPEHLDIVVASDGSTDATVATVKQLGHPRVRVIETGVRRGKAATLIDAVRSLTCDVIVFSDASTEFEPSAIRQLARHFVDPHVGVVTGAIHLTGEDGSPAEGVYWRWESKLRRNEARLGILTGASGAIYAIRRENFAAPSGPMINDDLVFPILSCLKSRTKFVLDETAEATVQLAPGFRAEFRRRVRIGTGACQALAALRSEFRPRNLRWTFAFASHKIVRWMGPLLLLLALICNLALLAHPWYRALLSAQIAFYVLAAIGLTWSGTSLPARVAKVAGSFCLMNGALFVGFVRWLRNPQQTTWEPTCRTAASGSRKRIPLPTPHYTSARTNLSSRERS